MRVSNRFSTLIVALTGMLVSPWPAFASEPLSLQHALEEAMENNPSLLGARPAIEIARGRLVRARTWNRFNPEMEGSLAERRFDGGGTATQHSAGVALEIEIAGQRGKRIEEAERRLARAEAEVADAARQIEGEVKDAFYAALTLDRRLRLFERLEKLNRHLRAAATERFRAGESPKLEENLAVIRHARSQSETLGTERDLRSRLHELERLLGREPTGTIEPKGSLEIPSLEVDPDRLVKAALRSRPDLRARTAEVERVESEIALVERSVVPNPTLRGIYDEETESGGARDRIVGGGISIPIPVFDRNQGELVSLAGEHGRALAERAATVLSVTTEVRNAWRSYTTARQAVALFDGDGLRRIEESYGFLETAFREGKIDLLRLLAGQNDLIDAELRRLESISEYWTAHVALERAIGRRLEEVAGP